MLLAFSPPVTFLSELVVEAYLYEICMGMSRIQALACSVSVFVLLLDR